MKHWITALLIGIWFSSCAQNQNHWDEAKQVFESPAYNLRWDLSEIGDWRIADNEQLPPNMLFCGAIDDISVSLVAIKKDGDISIRNGAEDFIDGFLSTALAESNVFPGLRRESIRYEQCHYLFKEALRFGVIEKVKDARLGTNEEVSYLYGGYMFEKDDMVFLPLVAIPFRYVEEYGETAMELFFQRLSYINASKELTHH